MPNIMPAGFRLMQQQQLLVRRKRIFTLLDLTEFQLKKKKLQILIEKINQFFDWIQEIKFKILKKIQLWFRLTDNFAVKMRNTMSYCIWISITYLRTSLEGNIGTRRLHFIMENKAFMLKAQWRKQHSIFHMLISLITSKVQFIQNTCQMYSIYLLRFNSRNYINLFFF